MSFNYLMAFVMYSALWHVFVLVDKFGPQLGPYLLFRVGPPFRMIGSDVLYTFCSAIVSDFSVTISDGLVQICWAT